MAVAPDQAGRHGAGEQSGRVERRQPGEDGQFIEPADQGTEASGEWVPGLRNQEAGKARQARVRERVDARLCLLAAKARVELIDLDGQVALLELGPSRDRLLRGGREVGKVDAGGRRGFGNQRESPNKIGAVRRDHLLQRVFGAGKSFLRSEDVLAERRHLSLCGDDVDAGQKPLFGLTAIARKLLLGEAHGFDLHFKIAASVIQFPVGLDRLCDDLDHRLPKLFGAQTAVLYRDLKAVAIVVVAEASPERLREFNADTRLVLRVQGKELVIAIDARSG